MTHYDPFFGPAGCVRFSLMLAALMLALVLFASWVGGCL